MIQYGCLEGKRKFAVNDPPKGGKVVKEMIVDEILDRKDGVPYDAARSMKYMYEEATLFGMTELARALDGGTEADVKRELCNYIDKEGYRPSIKTYINRHNWTGERRRRSEGRRAA